MPHMSESTMLCPRPQAKRDHSLSVDILPPHRSSTIWNVERKPDAEIEASIQRPRDELTKKTETPQLQRPSSYLYQRQFTHRKLIQAGLLLLSLALLHYVYFEPSLSRKVQHSTAQDQIPSLHFSTPTENAPFGLFIDDDKIWHIYFQSTSARTRRHGCASWGHATTSDLHSWTIQPLAFQDDDSGLCGGSVVIDTNNTSGFFPHQSNGVVALYTQYHPVTRTLQLAIAYSIDGGYVFNKYINTILRVVEATQDLRDPQAIWHEPTQQWILTAANANRTTIGIYTSTNLIEWAAASEFTNQDLGLATHEFEFPNLISIPRVTSTGAENPNWPTVPGGTVQYLGDYIFVSSSNRGSPLNGGSVTRYFPGKFNGTHFQPLDNRTDRFIDFGPDDYASQFFFGLSEGLPVVSVGLATNPLYMTSLSAGEASTKTGILTIPREGYLIHGPNEGDLSYLNRPVSLDPLRGSTLASLSAQNISGSSVYYNSPEAVLVEASLEMQPPDDEMVEFNIDFIFRSSKSSGHVLCTTVFRTWTADFGCDRSQASSNGSIHDSLLNQMSARHVWPLLPFHNPAIRRWEVQVIMDQSILEVFLNNGVRTGTTRIFSELVIDTIDFQSSEIPTWAIVSVNVQNLRPERNGPPLH